jgi:tripartite-type tricarboxylate transporter receptor subunit TctC
MRLIYPAALLAATLAAAAAPHALAQPYPNKPVRVIVAFTAGGTTDIMARTVGARLSDKLKQAFVIENKPGAGGNIGTEVVVRAPADGYTLIVNSVGPMAVNPTLYKSLPYNPVTDLVPVAQISDVPNVLVVHPSTGVKSMEDFIAYAKARSGQVNYASTGIGTSSHLSSYMLGARAGFEATHIPYKGAEALKDLLTGRVQFMFATIPSVIAHIKAGNLTAVAVSSARRSRSMPEVPTVAETGFPGFEAGSWFGFFAPKGTPREVVDTLNKAVNEIIGEKAVESRMIEEGADPMAGTPERFGAFVKSEFEKWRVVVQQSGAKVD